MSMTAVEVVLDSAIEREAQAADAYRRLADTVARTEVRELLLAIAEEEDRHREVLERVRAGDLSALALTREQAESEPWTSIGIAEPVVGPEINQARVLLAAIEEEQRSFELYSRLARVAEEPGLQAIFTALAQEEAAHRRFFERVYEEHILSTTT